jgi:exodeoxyribonuclease V alpha subunit
MSKLSDILAAAKARIELQKQAAMPSVKPTVIATEIQAMPNPSTDSTQIIPNTDENGNPIHYGIDRYGKPLVWNAEQWQFISTITNGKSAILIGAAGTGKTTTMRGSVESLLQSKYFPPLNDQHKHLPIGTPGIVFISYTRRAVMNLRKALPDDMKGNCITIHKLLEYQPVFYEIEDPLHPGEYKKTMRFEPNRHSYNHLDSNIKTVVFDESSMVSVDLFHKVWMALENPMNTQFIFLGDIQQLPPIFGSAILGFKMLSLPVIELTQVYRQALESPIIRLAHRILSGVSIPVSEFAAWKFPDQLTLHPWKKRISADSALLTIAAFFKKGYDTSNYDPEEDMILIPFNKSCGTDELNRHIANHIARKKDLVTHEVIAGFNKHYFSIGEKILYEKEDAVITAIKRNPTYSGKWPQHASNMLDYWGCLQTSATNEKTHHLVIEETESEADIDKMLETIAASSDVDDRVRDGSHILTIKLLDSEREVEIRTASEINSLVMAYALTVHKSQGSEWRRVFLILHQSHNTMIQRELLYTGCTRAREELYVICEPDSFEKGIQGQRIKGNTLLEKAEFFKGKLENGDNDLITMMSKGD